MVLTGAVRMVGCIMHAEKLRKEISGGGISGDQPGLGYRAGG